MIAASEGGAQAAGAASSSSLSEVARVRETWDLAAEEPAARGPKYELRLSGACASRVTSSQVRLPADCLRSG